MSDALQIALTAALTLIGGWIVSANTMKALHYFYTLGLVSSAELKTLYKKQSEHSSKSVRKKALLLIQELDG